MDAKFWHQRWQSNNIGFHQHQVNPLLIAHFDALTLPPSSRVFVPLCGKTLDIAWLLANGHQVAGAELSELAIQQLFVGLDIAPQITVLDKIKHYAAPNIDIFVGDIFDLTQATLGAVDAVFDRAALVALPPDLRTRYTQHLMDITHHAPQLLITYAYAPPSTTPPFSIPQAEIEQHYGAHYEITALAQVELPGGMKHATTATENVWLLSRPSS